MQESVIKNLESKFKFLAGFILVIFLGMMIRLWVLQIIEGPVIMVKSQQNQTRVIRMSAPRGVFYDRNNNILVSNRMSYNVSVVPEDVLNKPDVLTRLGNILNMTVDQIKDKLKPDSHHPRNDYQYVTIAKGIDETMLVKISEAKLDLPGVEVERVPIRFYPFGDFACHLFGYIREVSDQELANLKSKGYRLGDLIGKTGLEKTYEEYLRGSDGGKVSEVDIYGRPLRSLGINQPTPGDNLYLTIDKKLQTVAEKALSDELQYLQQNTPWHNAKSGALIAIDPRNGAIRAMVSKPGFDPNWFVGIITPEMAQQLYNNNLDPLTNRVIRGEFSPGSTFKPITVTTGLMEKKVDIKQKFFCNGYDPVWGDMFKCWTVSSHVPGHGWQTVIEGIKNSCNIVMADVARASGPDLLAKYCRFYGLGRPTGLDLYPGESSGLVPDTEWKRKNTKDKVWYPLETLHFGIGQGYLTVTPIQLAQLYCALAENGKVYQPQLVTKIVNASGEVVKEFKPQLSADLKIPAYVLDAIHQGLMDVVNEGGTADYIFRGFPLDKYPVAGKTGTVQKPPYDNTGVFACYAPSNDPQIVVIVLIEQGGGGTLVAPVGRKVLEAYFNLDEKPKPTPNIVVNSANPTSNSSANPVTIPSAIPSTAPSTSGNISVTSTPIPEPKPSASATGNN